MQAKSDIQLSDQTHSLQNKLQAERIASVHKRLCTNINEPPGKIKDWLFNLIQKELSHSNQSKLHEVRNLICAQDIEPNFLRLAKAFENKE